MFTLLVVDDEEYAVLGITKGIDWASVDIHRVLTASNSNEAKAILVQDAVNIVISDIEMPGENGIALLEWIKQNSPNTLTIFLTGHANFQYAHQALQYGCLEYLLKPVDYDELLKVVKKALTQLQKEKMNLELVEYYEEYKQLWKTQKPTFITHLWKDIIEGKLLANSSRLSDMLKALDIPLDISKKVVLILIKIEYWFEELDYKDKEVMQFAVCNVASESILEGRDGVVIQLYDNTILAIVYDQPITNIGIQDNDTSHIIEDLTDVTSHFIKICNLHLLCHLSCYISDSISISDVYDAYKELFRLEQENLTKPNSVLQTKDFIGIPSITLQTPDFQEWRLLLDSGKTETLIVKMKEYLDRVQEGHASKEMLESFCYGTINIVYLTLHNAGMQVADVFPGKNKITEGTLINSTQQAFDWAKNMIEKLSKACEDSFKNESSMVKEVKNFIESHIFEDFSRDDIANSIHFNADYLSRVFKKETGTVLSDYIILRRMTMARKLLEDTNDRIADIARNLGYHHFSHFARQFRNIIGLTPQEYRMKNRKF